MAETSPNVPLVPVVKPNLIHNFFCAMSASTYFVAIEIHDMRHRVQLAEEKSRKDVASTWL